MPGRFKISLLLVNIALLNSSYSQQAACPPVSTAQIVSDVVIRGASVNDGYGYWPICGVHGQVYRRPSVGRLTSVMRVSPDGSSLLFKLPDGAYVQATAPAGTGLNVLSLVYSPAERTYHDQMYHFDSQANLLTQNLVTIPIRPYAMAAMPSGRTIIVGTRSKDPYNQDEWKYGFVVLDEHDQLVRGVDLPLPPGGGGWTFASEMTAGDGVAYVMLHSDRPPQTAIATIAEKGNADLDIKVIDAPLDTETRHHGLWLFGPGVAVESYIYPKERPHITDRFDEYDLKTGQKIATKTAPGTGFQFGCYARDEFSMLAGSVHVDPARHLSPDTLRLVTSKLQ